jgi:penicillin-binding protein 1A
MVTRIEDNAGNTISTFSARKTEVISEQSSYKMIDMLRGVINGGTGSRVRRDYGITVDMGGKTGTTQNNSDGWFMGFTPSLVTGCWVGGEERDIHFDRMADGQGASSALPIWGLYMKKVFEDTTLPYSQDEKFDIPEDYNPCGSLLLNEESDEQDDESGPDTNIEEGFDDLFQ